MPERSMSGGKVRWLSFGCSLACAAALFAAAVPARAQTEPDELARRHFDSGAAYFEQAEYEAALREFEKAHELSARPEILLNIATIHERMGSLEAAVSTLDRYLAARPEGNDTIRIRRNNIQRRIDERAAPSAAPAPAPAPLPEATKPTPASSPATPKAPAAKPVTDDPAPAGGPNRVPAYVLFGVAGATGIASAITGIAAQAQYDALKEDDCAHPDRMDCNTGSVKGVAIVSTVLTGVAIVAGGAGLLWFFLAEDGTEKAHTASLAPRVQVSATPDAGFASARWRF